MQNIVTRDTEDAMRLFEHLIENLDPHSFTIDEIVDEGWDNRSSIGTDAMSEDHRKARVKRLLTFLIRQGLVEKPDEENVFSLTEAGHNKRY